MILTRDFYARSSVEVAQALLGQVIRRETEDGAVVLRITEVEAYCGADDAASHGYRGKTPRNEVMFGPAGHLYVYFTYGMHFCVNVVCGGEGECAAVLIRAGEVIEGVELARERRSASAAAKDRDLARGPARLTKALGLSRSDNGLDLCVEDGEVFLVEGPGTPGLPGSPEVKVVSGPRVGVSAAADVPWRFWIDGDPTVSQYKRHVPKKRSAGLPEAERVRVKGD